VRKEWLDNQHVVPYNPYLLSKFDCHVNVEIYLRIKAVKYLHKYIYDDHDKDSFQLYAENQENPVDEVPFQNLWFVCLGILFFMVLLCVDWFSCLILLVSHCFCAEISWGFLWMLIFTSFSWLCSHGCGIDLFGCVSTLNWPTIDLGDSINFCNLFSDIFVCNCLFYSLCVRTH